MVEKEDLADFVRRIRNEKGFSLNDVETQSGGAKIGISNGYISQIENRHVLGTNITHRKLKALAKGLKEPDEKVFAVARGMQLSGDELEGIEKDRFWTMYSDIPPQCQKDVMDLLEVLQKNHSISARQARRADRREIAAESGGLRIVEGERQPPVISTPESGTSESNGAQSAGKTDGIVAASADRPPLNSVPDAESTNAPDEETQDKKTGTNDK